MRTILATLALLAAALLAVGCTHADASKPVHADEPGVQTAQLVIAPANAPRCPILSPLNSGEQTPHGLVTVDDDPLRATLLWYPGRYPQGPCRVERTALPQQAARLIAADIRHAAQFPSGTYNCPNDVGQEIDIYLYYKGQSQSQVVRVRPGGCGTVDAPARGFRSFPPPLHSDLRAIAPADYRNLI